MLSASPGHAAQMPRRGESRMDEQMKMMTLIIMIIATAVMVVIVLVVGK